MRVLTWNLEWAVPSSARGREIRRRIDRFDADIMVLTETMADFMGDTGHTVCADPRPLFPGAPRRQKVVMWSRNKWQDADSDGARTLTDGRFVRGTTHTPLGPFVVWGVCVPWSHSHVRFGRRDKKVWQDHIEYLSALGRLFSTSDGAAMRLVVGDLNQRVPRTRSPIRAFETLTNTFADFALPTAGPLGTAGRLSIDHVAHDPGAVTTSVELIDETWGERRLSDHFGIVVDLELAG